MNKYIKEFLHRGLIFGGFGPIVAAIVYLVLGFTVDGFTLTGSEVFIAVVSTYLLAFVHAGVSVFNQIEHWPIAKSILFHFAALYVAYTVVYLINAWIPFDPIVLLIYTGAFVVTYAVIWIIVLVTTRGTKKSLNDSLKG